MNWPHRALTIAIVAIAPLFASAVCGTPAPAEDVDRTLTPAATAFETATPAAAGPDTTPLPVSDEHVQDMALVTSSFGWVLTMDEWKATDDDALKVTDDGGRSWRDVTPPAVGARSIAGVHFTDARSGWFVIPGPPSASHDVQLLAYRTGDGGATWQPAPLGPPSVAYASGIGHASISAIDERNAYVLVRRGSSSNFSFGDLFRTTDGGQSWSKLPEPPVGGKITFFDARRGFLAGGPIYERLYITHDGGETWTRQPVTPPPQYFGRMITFGAVRLVGSRDAVLPMHIGDPGPNTDLLYVSSDTGETWTQTTSPPVEGPTALTTVADTIIAGSTDELATSNEIASHWTTLYAAGFAPNRWMRNLAFASPSTGWALTNYSACPNKANCVDEGALYSTTDGGRTWTLLHP